jgi:hypothetical protein
MPFLYALISYKAHTHVLFKGAYDSGAGGDQVAMSKDDLFRQIILFSALSFNLIYIGVFLVFNRRDCILLNSVTLMLFCKDVMIQPGKYINM